MFKPQKLKEANKALEYAGCITPIGNGLGLTEMWAPTHVCLGGKNTPGTIGYPIPFVNSKIADPKTFEYTVTTGAVNNETAKFTGNLEREIGEEAGKGTGENGTYPITKGTLALADNSDGNFKASNYNLTVDPGKFTISKSNELTLTVNGYDGTYDGQSHGLKTATVNKEGAKIQYKKDGDLLWSDTMPTIKDVDTITVHVKATCDNYEDDEKTVTLKVNKRTINVQVNDVVINYGDAIPTVWDDYTPDNAMAVSGEIPAFEGSLACKYENNQYNAIILLM